MATAWRLLAPPTRSLTLALQPTGPAPPLRHSHTPLGSTLTTYPSSHSRIRRKKSPTKQTRSDLPAEDDDWQALRAFCEEADISVKVALRHLKIYNPRGGRPRSAPQLWRARGAAVHVLRRLQGRLLHIAGCAPTSARRPISNLVAQSWYDTVILHRDRQRHHAHQQRQDL